MDNTIQNAPDPAPNWLQNIITTAEEQIIEEKIQNIITTAAEQLIEERTTTPAPLPIIWPATDGPIISCTNKSDNKPTETIQMHDLTENINQHTACHTIR
jgi:hypothetical protein